MARIAWISKKDVQGKTFDTVVIGGGPAGYSAAVYAKRFLLNTIVIAKLIGGQLTLTDYVDDYPACRKIKATDLVNRFKRHAEDFGVKTYWGDSVESFEKADDGRLYKITTKKGVELYAKSIIVAVGTKRRKLGIPGEKEFSGRGVSYCSVCDAPLYAGKDSVIVVGGGDAAFEGALLLSGYVKKVYLVHRRKHFRAKPFFVERVLTKPNIEILVDSVLTEIGGDKLVRYAKVKNKVTGEEKEINVDGVFIEIGFEPDKEWAVKNGLNVDSAGYIIVDDWMRTNLPGVFAAGDCTNKWPNFRQVVTAAAMGSIAAYSAFNYLQENNLL